MMGDGIFDWSNSYEETLANFYAVKRVRDTQKQKAATPYTPTTPDLNNPIYSAGYYSLLNSDFNVWSSIVKTDFPESGWDLITSYGTMDGQNGVGVYGETPSGGNIANPQRAVIKRVRSEIKHIQRTVSMDDIQHLYSQTNDNTALTFEQARDITATAFGMMVEEMIMRDKEAEAAAGAKPATDRQRLPSLDGLVSDKAESNAFDAANNGHYSYYIGTDGSVGYNRHTSTTYDSNVITCSESETPGGANGTLLKDHLYDAIYNTASDSSFGIGVFVISWGLKRQLANLYGGQMRVNGENVDILTQTKMEFGPNGVSPARKGTMAGFEVQSIVGVPIIPTQRAISRVSDTEEASRIIGLNMSTGRTARRPMLSFAQAYPFRYWSVDSLKSPYGPAITPNNTHIAEAGFDLYGELNMCNPIAHVKIRDIERLAV